MLPANRLECRPMVVLTLLLVSLPCSGQTEKLCCGVHVALSLPLESQRDGDEMGLRQMIVTGPRVVEPQPQIASIPTQPESEGPAQLGVVLQESLISGT